MTGFATALRLARRELRGGIKGFRVFLACLTLGVAAIAAVGSVSQAITAGLQAGGREILGGDVALTNVHRDITPGERNWLAASGTVTRSIRLRAMARAPDAEQRRVIELKAVDGQYPLVGALGLEPPMPVDRVFAFQNGRWGAAVERPLLERLGLSLGDTLAIGDARVQLRSVLTREPDRAGSGRLVGLGPRVMISTDAVPATGLVRPGSLVHYSYRVVLTNGQDPNGWRASLDRAFPNAGWRIRDLSNSAPAVQRFVDRATLFLTLVGLTALLVGGIGVSNAVGNFLSGKTATIATLKCLGAPSRLVFQTYLAQIAAMTVGGIVPGLVLGALAPPLAGAVIAGALPVEARIGIYPLPLAVAATFGLLTALAFSLWPLARASGIPAAALFRDLVTPSSRRPHLVYGVATGAAAAALAALAVATADDRGIALWFVGGAIAAMIVFRFAGWSVMRLARAAPRGVSPRIRLALANLHRPGTPTASVVMSLGLGLTALVAVTMIENNLRHQISKSMPARAPDFFFIDIQPDQVASFEDTVRAVDGISRLRRTPLLRGRITAINGVPADKVAVAPGVKWMVRGDRGLTWSVRPHDGMRIVAGEWWPPDYRGAPLVSLTADAARGFGIGLGDTLTVNVLGRKVTARIANIREVRWRTLRMNFVMMFSPGMLERAPQTHIATLRATPASMSMVEKAVTDRFANVIAIRVGEVLATVGEYLDRIAGAVRLGAGITILVGTLVLAGAVAAGHRRRVYDAVVLKVVGATRRDVLVAYLAEFGILGSAPAAIALALGAVAAWAVVVFVMHLDWVFLPWQSTIAALSCTGITIGFGFAGAWRALGRKAAPLLRND